jgi:5-methyltetrahydrofolate--homocysteine methyltransferase
MDPEFVQDWERSRARFEAWWRNETLDRPPVLMTAKRERPRWPLQTLPDNGDPSARYLNLEYRMVEIENTLATTDYLGDAVPTFHRGINTGYLGLFAGVQPDFTPRTVWIAPCVSDWEAAPVPRFDAQRPLFRRILEISRALTENARGRYMLALPDHLDAVTTMSQMRGVENLVYDLVDQPEPAHRYRDVLVEAWKASFDFWVAEDRARGCEGVTNWAQLYSGGRTGMLQCDFSYMISPELFEQFVRPELAAEAAHLDGACYHLDGPGEVVHVECLCGIHGLTCVQWIPGAGTPRAVEWPDLLTGLQDRGKAIQVYCEPEDLDGLFAFLRPEGVLFVIQGSLSREECAAVLRRMERWSAARRA